MDQTANDPANIIDAAYETSMEDAFKVDIEQEAVDDCHLLNDEVRSFAWKGITVTVKDHKTEEPKVILNNVDGIVEGGK